MTMRTIACSCSLSGRPCKRWRTKPRARVTCEAETAGASDMRGVADAAFGRQVDRDRGAGADGAADVEGTAMKLGQLDGERKAETRPGMGEPGRLADPTE